jgi:mannose-6-phosphate isomerase-like protein (cupin superfamily)
MLIKQSDLISIKENKVTLVKNFAILEKTYDFNFLSKLMEENFMKIDQKTCVGNSREVFQMYNVIDYFPEFKIFYDFLIKLFKYERHPQDQVDLFYSFISQAGNPHVDLEDVFIIALKGKTIYRVFGDVNKDYTIEKGDMIFIPKRISHKVIGITPRIVASTGIFGKRLNG